MNYSRLFFLFGLFLFLQSCGGVENPFSNKKNNNNDEFLVEKKSPLVMPPNYNELPMPKSSETQANENENENVKKLITSQKNDQENNNINSSNKQLEEIVLEKIKNN